MLFFASVGVCEFNSMAKKKKKRKPQSHPKLAHFTFPSYFMNITSLSLLRFSTKKKTERDSSELDTREIDEDLYGDGRKRLH